MTASGNADLNAVVYTRLSTIFGTDNFPAKFLINDACVLGRRPYSHAGILRFNGQAITVLPHRSTCYRCLFLEPPPPGSVPSCSQAGVLGPIAGIMGTIQAMEASSTSLAPAVCSQTGYSWWMRST